MDETSYRCEMTDISRLKMNNSVNVRWLDVVKDYNLIESYFKLFNADIKSKDKNSMYFGIYIDDYSETPLAKGKLCAYVINNEILSFGGVEYISNDTWEVCAGSTHPLHLNKGYCKSVCSFILKYILENGKRAICETNINNKAAQKVLESVGMIRT